jgi:hypothetical protein
MTVSEKIVQNTLLQAIARVAMALTLPVFLLCVSYVAGALASQATDIALLQQQAAATERRLDASDARTQAILDTLQKLSIDMATTRTDAGYLRDWVEALKREARGP